MRLTVPDPPRLPSDACPYPRPFRSDFHSCPAYHGRPYIGLDVNYAPLPPVSTCRHLEAKRSPAPPHGFYSRCALGDAKARARFAAAMGGERFDCIRRVEREVIEFELPYLIEIEKCKARELMPAYVSGKREPQAARAEMKAVQARLLRDLAQFFASRPDLLEQIPVNPEAALEATRAWLDVIVSRPSIVLESWELPAERLAELPEDVRGLVAPSWPGTEAPIAPAG